MANPLVGAIPRAALRGVGVGVVFVLAACSSTVRGVSGSGCIPGESRTCAGTGCEGRQICDATGSMFSECECDGEGGGGPEGGLAGAAGGGATGGSGSGGSGSGGSGSGGSGSGGSGSGGSGSGGSSAGVSGAGATAGTAPVCATDLPGADLVPIPGGCIDAREVSQADYAAFLASAPAPSTSTTCAWNDSFQPRDRDNNCSTETFDPSRLPDHPVSCVDWCDAEAYCAWAGKKLCGSPAGGAAEYNRPDDPTVSSWFFACSGGGTTAFPWGDSFDAAMCAATSPRETGVSTSCVGGIADLFDMSGNVWEWENACDASDSLNDCCRMRGGSYGVVGGENTLSCAGVHASCMRRYEAFATVGFRCCT